MTSERVRATLDLARQLASAVASYRLFPGDLEQEAFVAAVARVASAVERATAAGPAGFEIRSGVVTIEGEAFPDDGNLGRFAKDCFDRRVEHITVLAAPSGAAIAAIGDGLAEPVELSMERGGPQRFLDERGVTSIALDAIAPTPQDAFASRLTALSEEQRELWERLANPEGFAASLIVEGLGDDVAGGAESVYRRFEVLFQVLPVDLVGRGDVFAKMRTALEALPTGIRREFLARVVSRAHRDQFASTFVNDMTDADLVTALLDLAKDGGPDPVDVARRIVSATGRSNTIVEMLEARIGAGAEPEEAAQVEVSAPLAALSRSETETQVRSAIADALGEGLVDASHRDSRSVREEWPHDEGALASLTYDALRDYLAAESDLERIDAVLDRWVDLARDAIRDADVLRLEGLLDLLQHPIDEGRGRPGRAEHVAHLEAAVDRVLTSDLIGELVDAAQDDATAARVRAVLRSFHGEALTAVLDRLASEQDRGVRSQLVRLAADLAAEDVDLISTRLDDPRWFVVRNLVTILGRTGDPQVLPMLVSVLNHGEPAVRRETVRALVSTGGGDAVPYVRRLAGDRDATVRASAVAALAGLRVPNAARALADVVTSGAHQEERQAAIAALRDHPSDEATELLEGVVKAKGPAKLPRALRKAARAALKARRTA